MLPYKNLSGKSGVASYEIGTDRMIVEFKNGDAFLYDDRTNGTLNLAIMQDLARAGKGLNTFINRFIKDRYWSQLS